MGSGRRAAAPEREKQLRGTRARCRPSLAGRMPRQHFFGAAPYGRSEAGPGRGAFGTDTPKEHLVRYFPMNTSANEPGNGSASPTAQAMFEREHLPFPPVPAHLAA